MLDSVAITEYTPILDKNPPRHVYPSHTDEVELTIAF